MKNKVYVSESKLAGAGRGVFAARKIKKGEVIEVCPILIIWDPETLDLAKTKLAHYVFDYPEKNSMLALGNGSLYNHLKKPNAKYELLTYEGKGDEYNELCISALKTIDKDDEIYINYGEYFDEQFSTED